MSRSAIQTYIDDNLDTNGVQGITGAELHSLLSSLATEAVIKNEVGDVDGVGIEWSSSKLQLKDLGVITAKIADGAVTLAKQADLAQARIVGRASGAGTGVPTALTASDVSTILGLAAVATSGSASDLGTGTLPIARIADGAVTLAKQADLAQARIVGRASGAGTGVPTALTASDVSTILGLAAVATSGSASDLGTGTLPIARIADGAVTLAKQADLAQARIVGRASGAGTGVPTALTASDVSTILGLAAVATSGSASDLGTGTLPIARIADGAVTLAKQADLAQARIVGRASGAGTGVPTALTASDVSTILGLGAFATSTDLANATGTLAVARIAAGTITYAKINDATALSVLGRSANTSGVLADIVGADGQVLRVSGTVLGFGTIATAGIADAAVTLAKQANLAQATVIGRASGAGTGVPTALTASDVSTILGLGAFATSTDLANATGTLAIARIADASITAAKFENQTGLSVWGRSANSSGVGAAIVGSDGQVLRVSGTVLGFGTLASENLDQTVDTHNTDYTFVLTDAGKTLLHTQNGVEHIYTIPPNSSVAFAIGSRVRIAVTGSGIVDIAQGSGVSLATAGGSAASTTPKIGGSQWLELVKVATNTWLCNTLLNKNTFMGNNNATDAAAAESLSVAEAITLLGLATVATSGDAGDLTGTLAAARIAANSLPLGKLATIADQRILGNVAGSTTDVIALTAAQVAVMIGGSFADITMTNPLTMAGTVLSSTATLTRLRTATVDGTDNSALSLFSTGQTGAAIARTRGAGLILYGNEHANTGDVELTAGEAGNVKLLGQNIDNIFFGSKTYDPPSTATAASWQTTVTVTGAVVGDLCKASHSQITTQKWILGAQVSSNDTVTVTGFNNTGGTVDLASGTLRVMVLGAPS
jgi:hypothetical protein